MTNDAQAALGSAFDDDELLLIRKPSGHLREWLPKHRKVISIHCCLIRENLEIWMFGLIDQLGRVFPIKGRTQGRSTDKLGDKNSHISLGPLIKDVGDWAVIGRDRTVEKGEHTFSLVDVNLVLNAYEGFSLMRPTIIVPP